MMQVRLIGSKLIHANFERRHDIAGGLQQEELRSLRGAIEEAEAELKELKRAEAKQTEAGAKLRRAVREHEASLEALAAKQADILHMASLEQVRAVLVRRSL